MACIPSGCRRVKRGTSTSSQARLTPTCWHPTRRRGRDLSRDRPRGGARRDLSRCRKALPVFRRVLILNFDNPFAVSLEWLVGLQRRVVTVRLRRNSVHSLRQGVRLLRCYAVMGGEPRFRSAGLFGDLPNQRDRKASLCHRLRPRMSPVGRARRNYDYGRCHCPCPVVIRLLAPSTRYEPNAATMLRRTHRVVGTHRGVLKPPTSAARRLLLQRGDGAIPALADVPVGAAGAVVGCRA